ncbi:hypothetical protein IE077_002137, partial [Cardiosporidium cionae]
RESDVEIDCQHHPLIDFSFKRKLGYAELLYFENFRCILMALSIKVDLEFIETLRDLYLETSNFLSEAPLHPSLYGGWLESPLTVPSINVCSNLSLSSPSARWCPEHIHASNDYVKESIKVYMQNFHIHPLLIKLSYSPHVASHRASERQFFERAFLSLSAMDEANVSFTGFRLTEESKSLLKLIDQLVECYKNQAEQLLASFLGSVEIFGTPARSLEHVTAGVKDLAIESFWPTHKGETLFDGLVRGTESLIRTTGYGVFGGLSKMAGAASQSLGMWTMDEDYIQEQKDSAIRIRPRDLGEGVVYGAEAFRKAFVGGLTGLVQDPIKGVKDEGVEGFLKGTGRGLMGAVFKPLTGALDFAQKTTEGIQESYEYNRSHRLRRRLPRMLYGADRIIKPFEIEHAVVRDALAFVESKCWANIAFISHLYDKYQGTIIIISETHLLQIALQPVKALHILIDLWRILRVCVSSTDHGYFVSLLLQSEEELKIKVSSAILLPQLENMIVKALPTDSLAYPNFVRRFNGTKTRGKPIASYPDKKSNIHSDGSSSKG